MVSQHTKAAGAWAGHVAFAGGRNSPAFPLLDSIKCGVQHNVVAPAAEERAMDDIESCVCDVDGMHNSAVSRIHVDIQESGTHQSYVLVTGGAGQCEHGPCCCSRRPQSSR